MQGETEHEIYCDTEWEKIRSRSRKGTGDRRVRRGGVRTRTGSGTCGGSVRCTGEPVASPMPGTILDVRCSNGQAVKKGDVLFILEAMKMENEIFAPKDGTVTAVCTSKGAAVETGATLCTLA